MELNRATTPIPASRLLTIATIGSLIPPPTRGRLGRQYTNLHVRCKVESQEESKRERKDSNIREIFRGNRGLPSRPRNKFALEGQFIALSTYVHTAIELHESTHDGEGRTRIQRASSFLRPMRLHNMHQLAKPPRQPPTATSVMLAISAAVKQAFVRIERAGEALVGHVGPFFVAIYVGLVGTGMWIFCMCVDGRPLTSSCVHLTRANSGS